MLAKDPMKRYSKFGNFKLSSIENTSPYMSSFSSLLYRSNSAENKIRKNIGNACHFF